MTALVGLAVSAAFFGPRTAGPIAASFIDPLTIWTRLLGIVAGLVVIAIGLRIVGLAGDVNDGASENT
ncbi:hypothetical protein ACFR99_01360 [Haloarchaeobius amylolyticus]|uniref:Uncharacterized protein n=1 Tax=Haloarchaeobius amylolyticus TaxID=1198296 RepID=A0ABD6BCH3_9EURY